MKHQIHCSRPKPNTDELIKLYGQLVFKSWLNELLEGGTGVVLADEKSGAASGQEPLRQPARLTPLQ